MTTWAFALFILITLGAFLAIFIYSIVAKKHWLTTAMIVGPVVSVLMIRFISVPQRTKAVRETVVEARNFQMTDIAWSNSLPPTADIYPSIPSCGRPLAFQIAEQIRQDKRSKKKFAVTFVKETYAGDHDQWKPPEDFVANFRGEFVKQFPGSDVAVVTAEAKSANQKLQPLEIKLSFKPTEKIRTGKQIAGTISARWTTRSGTRAVALIDYVDKPWVLDPDDDGDKGRLSVGYSKRLARSPAEAASLARDSVQALPVQVIDRFRQKLSLPYGELWQEAVLVNTRISANSTMRGYYVDLLPLVRNWESERPPTRLSQASLPQSEAQPRKLNSRSGLSQTSALIVTTIGLVLIGFISNLLTQGYYRQNINPIIFTGVAVVIGLILLGSLFG